ncbi:hypothetical protein KKF91_17265, partial [Myxococcota bacterium]|nr:hypothetical protein [Myxococcota bacterium]
MRHALALLVLTLWACEEHNPALKPSDAEPLRPLDVGPARQDAAAPKDAAPFRPLDLGPLLDAQLTDDGEVIEPDGEVIEPDGEVIEPDGE